MPSVATHLGLSYVSPKAVPLPSPLSAFLPTPLLRSARRREEGGQVQSLDRERLRNWVESSLQAERTERAAVSTTENAQSLS